MPINRRMGIILSGTAAAALVAGLLLRGGTGVVAAQTGETVQVEQQIAAERIETTGRIAPATTLALAFRTTGIVKDVVVEVGDSVAVGDMLAALETTDLANQVARQEQTLLIQQASYEQLIADPTDQQRTQAESTLAAAQSQVEQARSSQARAESTRVTNCANVASATRTLRQSQADYDDYLADGYTHDATFLPDADAAVSVRLADAQTAFAAAEAQCSSTPPASQYAAAVTAAEASFAQAQAALNDLLNGATDTDIASAQAQVKQAELQVADAQDALKDATLLAPQAGVISAVNLVAGQFVPSGSTAVVLVDTNQLHIDVTVDELDIAYIALGQTVEIKTEALDGVTLTGTVSRIAPTADTTDGVVTYAVRVDLAEGEEAPVRVGMTADVSILVSEAETVLVVPTAAIQRSGTQEFVTVQNADGTTVEVFIISGSTRDEMTEVQGDLEAGTTIILPAQTETGRASGPFGG